MIYAVDHYLDQIKVKKERELNVMAQPRFHYFDTEQEAKKFIIDRAFELAEKADRAANKAHERFNKCARKFK